MDRQPLRVGILSTYAPQACGLATFAADLETAVRSAPGVADVGIIRIEGDETNEEFDTPQPQVIAQISQDEKRSYRLAARTANERCDVVVVQHEFGIFGGADGSHLLQFLAELRIPAVMTLHTVLPTFTAGQAEVLRSACETVQTITVFTSTARRLLVQQGIVSPGKIRVVPHGAPDILYEAKRADSRRALALDAHYVISTFGLISPGKGLELAIEALPEIVNAVPSALLVIAGRTHPGIRRRDGEQYREGLVARSSQLGMAGNVRFMNEFMPVARIADLLAGTDVFVTPYVNPEQIVSGALTFALAAGCPVVSTDYQYARDQLSDGAGEVVAGRNPGVFADAILGYALDSTAAASARAAASVVGATMRWSEVGRQTALICHETVRETASGNAPVTINSRHVARRLDGAVHPYVHPHTQPLTTTLLPAAAAVHRTMNGAVPAALPPSLLHPSQPQLATRHLERLVDDTGIIQHATGAVPLLSSGYCVDDVARLISVAYAIAKESPRWESVVARSVAFIAHAAPDTSTAERPSGRGALLHNFLSWNRTWSDTPYFGDHVGRAAWGLSAVAADNRFADVASPLLRRLLMDWPEDAPLHATAYALLAQANVPWLVDPRQLYSMISRLTVAFGKIRCEQWEWFEPTLRYDHARFSHALLAAGWLAEDAAAVGVGLRSLRWYDELCDQGEFFSFPGHRGVAEGDAIDKSGDEQPLEALALAQAHDCAFEITNDPWHRSRALRAYEWFVGRNRLGISVVDSEGGCCDGLEPNSLNRNQGAESTLAYCASYQLVAALGLRSKERLFALPAIARPTGIVS